MPTELQPGRPSNLTPEQEARLKEMWAYLLKHFGVANGLTLANGEPVPSAAEATAAAEANKKKPASGGGGFWGRKTAEVPAEDAANDKFGQVKEFHAAIARHSPEELRSIFWNMLKHDNPDALLLRFLRARKWHVQNALIMMVSTFHWRQNEFHLDDEIMPHGEAFAVSQLKSSDSNKRKESEGFIAQMRTGKSFIHGIDREGRPLSYVRVRLHKIAEHSQAALERFIVYTIETGRLLLQGDVDTATLVFDMTDFGMRNMDYTPVKFIIKCFEANYPESLGCVLIYRAPWIFQGIWKIIRGWLDPVVASKVHFASNVDELEQWIQRDRILSDLGGDEKFTYTYPEPTAGENALMEDTETRDKLLAQRDSLGREHEQATVAWIKGANNNGDRTAIWERLRANYWEVDPYIRARSALDREGVIQKGGKLDFYPAKGANGATA